VWHLVHWLLMKPLLFGKYCLLERISVGGMAEVFRAKPFNAPQFKGYLALKRILPHLAEDDEFITMFIDEARLTVQLQHPNIVRIYELGQFQTSYYILMEFIAGKDVLTLQKRVRKRKETIGIQNSVFIAREIARGLDFAHRKTDESGRPLNIIHRDISPQNVLVDYLGEVKVIDFGIAKAAIQSSRTQVGVLKGKMGYMSPEQVQGLPLDHRSDVFAIGTVLWEMLTNRRLFHGENEFETMQMVKACEVVPPSQINPEIPPELDAMVLRAVAPRVDARYSAAELADDLSAWLKSVDMNSEKLSTWMREIFAEDLGEELEKRQGFSSIVTADDVRRISLPAHDVPDSPEEEGIPKTEIWAGEPPPSIMDDLEFAAQHTVVQAGGFDPSMLDTHEQKPLTLRQSHQEYSPSAEPLSSQAFASEGTQRSPVPRSSSGKLIWGLGGLAAILFLALCVAGTALVYKIMTGEGAQNTAMGSILLNVRPADGVQVRLNGELRSGGLPMRLDHLGVGTHVLEIGAPGFREERIPVEVGALNVIPVDVELRPAGTPTGRVAIQLQELPGLRVFIDGAERGVDEIRPYFDAPVGVTLVEVLANEHRPYREFVEVESDGNARLEPKLEPIGFPIQIHGDPQSVVRFGGRRIGVVPVEIERVHPLELNQLELTLRGEGVSRWSTYVALPLLREGRITGSFDSPPRSLSRRDYGTLSVDTEETWWAVWVDDIDTGLVTPIDTNSPLPLQKGKYKLTLKRGYQQHDFEIEVKGGELTTFSQSLPFEYQR